MPAKVDEIHDTLIDDPDFAPQDGKTKDEAAWAVAWSRYNQMEKNNAVFELSDSKGFDLFKTWTKKQSNPSLQPAPDMVWNPETRRWNKKSTAMARMKSKVGSQR